MSGKDEEKESKVYPLVSADVTLQSGGEIQEKER